MPIPAPTLSIVVPWYDNLDEAIDLCRLTREQIEGEISAEWILVALDPKRINNRNVDIPTEGSLIYCEEFRGIPYGKNAALKICRGTFVLFLFPGIRPVDGAIAQLLSTIQADSKIAAVSGRWDSSRGSVEKGYNVRRSPGFLALVLDVLLLNKLLPSNRVTRSYKMHDFDHQSPCEVEHANDSNFMVRRDLLTQCGKFDEAYRIGWFDQLDMCRRFRRQGLSVLFQPAALFLSQSEPLINRIVGERYSEYYQDELQFVRREFGPEHALVFRVVLAGGMLMRMAFASVLTGRVRRVLLKKYRSYVDEDYILKMNSSYWKVLCGAIRGQRS